MNPSNATGPSNVRWRMIGLLTGLCFVSHLNRLAMSVAGTERIIPRLGVEPTQMGMVYSAYLAVYTAAMLGGGWCIDRYGPRVMLAVMGMGSAVFGVLTGSLGFAALTGGSLVAALVVVRGLMGLFTAPLHPGCARAVAAWMPPGRVAWANGVVTFGAVLGMTSTYPLFGALMDWLDWPGAFLVVAAVLFGLTILWWAYAKDHPERHQGVNEAEKRLIFDRSKTKETSAQPGESTGGGQWFSRGLLLLTLSYAAVGYFQYLFFYWSEYYFKEVVALSVGQSRNATTLLVLALGLGMPAGGFLTDWAQARWPGRWGRAIVPGMSMAVSAGCLFLGLAAQSPAGILLWFTLTMGALGMSESSFWQAAVEMGGRRGALAAAVVNTGGNGIGLLAPLLTPWISELFGWRAGIALGGAVCLMGAFCWLGVDLRIRPSDRSVEPVGAGR